MRTVRLVLFPTIAALAFACARSDVGAPCHLQDANGAELRPQPGREYLYLGSSECESFACLAPPGAQAGYCSQVCSGPDASCPAGMTCQELTLNDPYLAAMQKRLATSRFQQLFGELSGSFYCARAP
jgi:hypothetical protein